MSEANFKQRNLRFVGAMSKANFKQRNLRFVGAMSEANFIYLQKKKNSPTKIYKIFCKSSIILIWIKIH